MDKSDPDFLDLDGTCAAAAKRFKDANENIISFMKNFMEPYEETARACGEDEEAFWKVLENEYEVSCPCQLVRKMAEEMEGRLTMKEVAFFLCYGVMKMNAQRFKGMLIMASMLKKLQGEQEQEGTEE